MECRLDTDKIKQGIADTVKQLVAQTGVFDIVDDSIYPRDLPAENNKADKETLLSQAMENIDDIQGFYKTLISSPESMEQFLQEISDQYYSSDAERKSAIKISGEMLADIAAKMFPQPERRTIAEINQQFHDFVLKKTGPGEWTVAPSDDLAMQYLMAQPNSKDVIMDKLRTEYLSQFTSTSMNLLDENKWLNHPALQDPTTKDLLDFARKINPNFRVVVVTDDLNVNAVSLIRDNIIFIRQGSIIDDLPEEISHFFFELLPDDSPIKLEMMDKIVDFPIYLETYRLYKDNEAYQINGRPDIQKIKREASAKLIGDYIKAAYQNKADSIYGKKRGWLKQIVHRFMKWLRRQFMSASSQPWSEPLFDENSPFMQAAQEIVNKDVSLLNLQKQSSIYDSIFFSKIEDEIEEGYEASDIAKSLFEFSRQLKRQVIKTFYTYITKQNMTGLKEMLDDPQNKNINKIWDIVNRIDDAGLILKEMQDSTVTDMISMVRATSTLAEAYREMEQIPDAITEVLRKIKNDGSEQQILDNITELQTYFQFSDTFTKITEEFITMLSFLKDRYEMPGLNGIYDIMIDKMGATEVKFKVVDDQIMKSLQKHIIALTHKWTDEAFTKYRGEINVLHDSLEHHRLKNKVSKLITERITSLEQIRQAVTGNFPNARHLMQKDGTKIDLKRIKDISQVDYVIFMFASPTLINDPFISNLMAHFTDKYVAAAVKGQRESKLFADKVLPIKKELADMGVGWYEAEEAIQNVQPFYDQATEDNKTEKRVFLSQTNRFNFQYEKQVRIQDIVTTSKELERLQAEFLNVATTDERKKQLEDTLVPEKKKQLQDKRDDYDKFLGDWSFRSFTPEFYEKQKNLKDKKNDSPTLRKWKDLNRRILNLENIQYTIIATESTINDSLYDDITQQIALLQNEKLQIQDQIPPTEQSVLDALNDIYEVDEVATSRLRQRHKNQWVRSFVAGQRTRNVQKSDQELENDGNRAYDALYTVVVPKQEFYDAREAIFNEINKVSRPQVGLDKLAARLEELKEREKKLLKPFRDNIRGEVAVSSFKFISIEKNASGKDMLLSESLKELEEEIDMLNNKMRIYSTILASASLGDAEKAQILSFIDLSLAFSQVINNQLTYTPQQVKAAFKGLIDLSTSQAEQILSAVKKAAKGDNSEFNALSNLQLGNVPVNVKNAYGILNFNSPQNMMDAENAMYGAFKHFTRRERGIIAESLAYQFQQLGDLYSNTVSLQYYLALAEFFHYYQMYVEQDQFNTPDKRVHGEKFLAIRGAAPATVADVENMLGDGVFESVLEFMMWKERNEINPSTAYPLSDTVDFLVSLHKQKVTFVDGEMYTTWTPISYVKKPNPNPELTEKRSPRFLTRNRIKDKYRTEKVYETDPEVIAGNKEANVDINGEWLPLNKLESPFWNKDYAKLKAAKPNTQDGKLFQLLQAETQAYLAAQQEYLPEGERLDLVIPAKYADKFEQKKILITKIEDGWRYIRSALPFGAGKSLQEEEQNYLEEISAVTAQNRDIYTGAIIAEKNAKLRSRRRIALERTTKDATSSVAMFFEDVNEYSAKTVVAPIMKSFADVFKYAYEANPRGNKLRAGALQDLYTTKVLDEVPDVAANNPNLAKVLRVVNRLATFRLLGDPVGALINVTSGTLQQMIEANWTKAEFQMFMKGGWRAKDWLVKYDADFYRQSTWGLETQLIGVFNMIPDNMEISNHLSKAALFSSIRSKLMAPRQETEKYMAIHMGLAIVMAEPIVFEGKALTPVDLYELDPVTNLIRLKDQYKSLEKEWEPVSGTKVIQLRRRLIQKYTLLQGNFFKQNQSFASTTALGKSAEIMKRWFATGVIRRYQGEVNDPFLNETRKGMHLAMGNIIGNLLYGLRKGDMKYINEYWTNIAKRPSEKAALRRAVAEAFYTLVFGVLAFMVLGYDDDDEDRNKKLREMSYLKQLALLITVRVQGELGTFIPVPLWGLGYMEMKRAILDPFGLPKGSFDNLMGLGALLVMQGLDVLGVDYDKQLFYQKSKPYAYNFFGAGAIKDKGDSKLKALIFNTIGYTGYTFEPGEYIKNLTQMQQRIK